MNNELRCDLEPRSEPRFRLKVVPLVVVTLLALTPAYLGAAIASFFLHITMPLYHPPQLPWLYVQHAAQLGVGLLLILLVKRWVPADYGLHWPRGRTEFAPALLWGALFGVIMTLVDYAPQLLAARHPQLGYPLTKGNVVGWLFFEFVYVGPTEEIPFRALLVTYLATTMPGKLRIGRWQMNWAGVIVAILFALLHATNFSLRAWPLALGQQIYAFILGVLYAYWLEKSRSIVAPIIGHNMGDGVEYAIVFLWVAASGR
ncbi:MAG TPA: CPBP family intramembrane glutamic endopeptidase [Steroidobacteraceae bacterium]|nr:CPBP family intramembrane glutamic endopeptidase [Steroidobacteraceae bacterium]